MGANIKNLHIMFKLNMTILKFNKFKMKNSILLFLTIFLNSLAGISQTTFVDVATAKGILPSIAGDTHGSGVSAADFDNDGDIDLYVCTERGQPDLLYKNVGGTYTEVGQSLGLSSSQRSRMALWLDFNGDGLLDILVAGDCDRDENDCPDINNLQLFKQENGVFIDVTDLAGLTGLGPSKLNQTIGGIAAGDINSDGHVDFVQTTRNGQVNLFLNTGNSSFINISEEASLTTENFKYYQPYIVDINGDGYADIYCNIDFTPNQLWIQGGDGKFTDVAASSGADNSFNEMGIAIADYDNDGDFDIYSTNIANYLGEDVYNILLRNELNNGSLLFTDASKELNVDQGGWGWGATFLDINNNGWLDLATTNGFDVPFEVVDQSKLWINNDGTSFTDVSTTVGFDDELIGTTIIALDYDQDGDLDLVQTLKGKTAPSTAVRLLENQLLDEGNQNYLTVRPRMIGNNYFAIGAIVKIRTGSVWRTRLIHAGTSFYGQEPAEAFFGIGSSSIVDELKIIWPGGAISTWQNVNINQVLTVTDEDIVHAPSFLKADQTANTIVLSWNDYATNETDYTIQKSLNIDFAEFSEVSLPADAVSYIDSDVEANSIYYYRIFAYNNQYTSEFSETIEVVSIIAGLAKGINIAVFPNPITLNQPLIVKGIIKVDYINLFDLAGHQIPVKSYEQKKGKVYIYLKDVKEGIYVLSINGIQKKIWIR